DDNGAKNPWKPTDEMAANARRALAWRDEYGRGGTAVGIARARDISNGRRLPRDTIMRMVGFFARHEVDKRAEGFREGEPGFPSNGRIAWDLWGGDAGRAWANRIADRIEELGE
ncbi:MAG: phage major capsid protein, partial [bacterium]